MLADNIKITCGRTMLNWTQKEAATVVGLPQSTISNIEKDPHRATKKHVDRYLDVLRTNGIVFTENGVEKVDRSMVTLTGDDWYLQLLGDIYQTLKDSENKEVLELGADESASSAETTKLLQKFYNEGFKFRTFVKDGDTNLPAGPENYRYTPKAYFKNWLTIIYGEKVAIESFKDDIKNPRGCIIIRDKDVADVHRNYFEWMWNTAKKPDMGQK